LIVDSSAIVAIVREEYGFEQLIEKLRRADVVAVSAVTLVETGIVLRTRVPLDTQALLDRFLRDFDVELIAFGEEHWREATDAYDRFGRGRHPAALNFGDCLSYATARLAGQPLLFVGGDFARTDIGVA
jgi:ribonuclease VapC